MGLDIKERHPVTLSIDYPIMNTSTWQEELRHFAIQETEYDPGSVEGIRELLRHFLLGYGYTELQVNQIMCSNCSEE
jgi:hypothetical protein